MRAPGGGLQISDFEILRVLGKGYMGKVMAVRDKTSNEIYALKSIHKKAILERKEVNHTRSERDVLVSLTGHRSECPFLVRLHSAFQDANNVYFLMDFHSGGDLAGLLAHFVRLNEHWAKFYAAELVMALGELHSLGIVYRDLKPENILLSQTGHVVLVDFGLCKQLKSESKEPGAIDSVITATTTFCGTPEYLAPEILLRQPYGLEVDWWSFGILLFEMLFGITPFWDDNPAQIYHRIVNNSVEIPKNGASPAAQDLLMRLLTKNSHQRISEEKIRQHPFFAKVHWDDLKMLNYKPPYVPFLSGSKEDVAAAFDPIFTNMTPQLTPQAICPSSLAELAFRGFTFRNNFPN